MRLNFDTLNPVYKTKNNNINKRSLYGNRKFIEHFGVIVIQQILQESLDYGWYQIPMIQFETMRNHDHISSLNIININQHQKSSLEINIRNHH